MSKIQNSKKLSQKNYILYNKLEKQLKAEGGTLLKPKAELC